MELAPILLNAKYQGESVVVGLALLPEIEPPLRRPRPELLRAIARCLLDTGDSEPYSGGVESDGAAPIDQPLGA